MLATACAAPLAQAQTSAQPGDQPLDQRVQRLERLISGKGLMEVLLRLEQLQREVQELRGELEIQSHDLEGVRKRQRDLYIDLDRRIGRLEGGAAAAPSTAATGAPVTPPVSTNPPVQPAERVPPGGYDTVTIERRYRDARELLDSGRYEESIQAFREFLDRYPGNALTGNALYWLGEAYYVTRDFDRALAEFQKVGVVSPNSPKLPDSLLKVGYIYYEKQDWIAARDTLAELSRSYPDSTATRLALQRLDRMQREGH